MYYRASNACKKRPVEKAQKSPYTDRSAKGPEDKTWPARTAPINCMPRNKSKACFSSPVQTAHRSHPSVGGHDPEKHSILFYIPFYKVITEPTNLRTELGSLSLFTALDQLIQNI